jgi:hypothetical protein
MGDRGASAGTEDKFSQAGRLAAELLNGNCTAVFVPEKNLVVPNDESLRDRLRTFASLDELCSAGDPPVAPLEEEDPRLVQAVAEA